ncbi:MAG: ArsO family NAD(P)H-dependent flavin-containing monooxygenase [Schleiferiaceae bacterium]|jgi:cation diffusion facilitator CzcD-associated flavoprotein CzcO|nr:ArsO family NAD(P)H-dependent flavin-containing monooxygenase [Schleiferiaceae bacterium]
MKIYDTIVIGGGQAGLSTAFYLRRKKLDFLVLDENEKPGGAWLHTWDSLRLFSPTEYSSLHGWAMPKSEEEYPTKSEFIAYLEAYEKRYDFPVKRNSQVLRIEKEGPTFKITTNNETFITKTIVSATGTAKNPFIPNYPQSEIFNGKQVHSVDYQSPKDFENQKVLVVGGGNSGAQILAELSLIAHTQWVTLEEPDFLPEDIDGRYLFNQANDVYFNRTSPEKRKASLAQIVQVAPVRDGLKRDIFHARSPFSSFFKNGVNWEDGTQEEFDAVLWCTGFKANLSHLENLHLENNGRLATKGTRVINMNGLWLVGYGNWTGFASATIYGVGKTARLTANEIQGFINGES